MGQWTTARTRKGILERPRYFKFFQSILYAGCIPTQLLLTCNHFIGNKVWYEGEFANGLWDGWGREYSGDGKVLYYGRWHEGVEYGMASKSSAVADGVDDTTCRMM